MGRRQLWRRCIWGLTNKKEAAPRIRDGLRSANRRTPAFPKAGQGNRTAKYFFVGANQRRPLEILGLLQAGHCPNRIILIKEIETPNVHLGTITKRPLTRGRFSFYAFVRRWT
jgi:hypothetical protein